MRRCIYSRRSYGESQRVENDTTPPVALVPPRTSNFAASYGLRPFRKCLLSYNGILLPLRTTSRHDFPSRFQPSASLQSRRFHGVFTNTVSTFSTSIPECPTQSLFTRDIDCQPRTIIACEHNARICRNIQRQVRYTNERTNYARLSQM